MWKTWKFWAYVIILIQKFVTFVGSKFTNFSSKFTYFDFKLASFDSKFTNFDSKLLIFFTKNRIIRMAFWIRNCPFSSRNPVFLVHPFQLFLDYCETRLDGWLGPKVNVQSCFCIIYISLRSLIIVRVQLEALKSRIFLEKVAF